MSTVPTGGPAPRRRALVAVDVQGDFCEGGSLAVPGGAAVAARIGEWLAAAAGRYALAVASQDWHHGPPDTNGGHLALGRPPDFATTWPVHCVAGTPGAQFHPAFAAAAGGPGVVRVRKGQGRPSYSAFEAGVADGAAAGTPLLAVLRAAGVTELDIAGIATDHCCLATARDALGLGFAVTVLTDLQVGVDPGAAAAAVAELAGRGAHVTSSSEVS